MTFMLQPHLKLIGQKFAMNQKASICPRNFIERARILASEYLSKWPVPSIFIFRGQNHLQLNLSKCWIQALQTWLLMYRQLNCPMQAVIYTCRNWWQFAFYSTEAKTIWACAMFVVVFIACTGTRHIHTHTYTHPRTTHYIHS